MIFAWSLHLETEDKKEIVLFLCWGFVSFSICLWPLPRHVNHSSRKTKSSRTLPVSFLSSPSHPFSHPLPHPSRILRAPVSSPPPPPLPVSFRSSKAHEKHASWGKGTVQTSERFPFLHRAQQSRLPTGWLVLAARCHWFIFRPGLEEDKLIKFP